MNIPSTSTKANLSYSVFKTVTTSHSPNVICDMKEGQDTFFLAFFLTIE
jgi:hypothetical protein